MPETFQGSFLCLQGLILIPGTCSNEWANTSLGQRLRTHSVCTMVFLLSCSPLLPLLCLAFSLPHSWDQESKLLLDFKYKIDRGRLFWESSSHSSYKEGGRGERKKGETTSFQASVCNFLPDQFPKLAKGLFQKRFSSFQTQFPSHS